MNNFLWHIKDLWYLIKTKQICIGRTTNRKLGYDYFWYDGPHYLISFYFWCVEISGFKDHAKGMSILTLITLVEKLSHKKLRRW